MKPATLLTALLLWIGYVFNSCAKEYSCENCKEGNKPPIANAGQNQLITLPSDSTQINGKGSKDPDGFIVTYNWKLIVGTNTATIANPDSAITVIKNLTPGEYTLELKVTDNDGLSSADSMLVRVKDPGQPNKPPIARAGDDQTYALPVNSITLDGNKSYDPDGTIVSYSWKQIAGDNQTSISNPTKANTQVSNVTGDNYLFELTVTDNGGLSSKDTLQISTSPTPNCLTNRPERNAQLIYFGKLSEGRIGSITATALNKILFAGGIFGQGIISKRVDIYDYALNAWSTADLSIARNGMGIAANGNKIYIAGGGDTAIKKDYSRIDIYDAASNTWSIAELSEARSYIAVIAMGDNIYFAGGSRWVNNIVEYSNRIDIYNTRSGTWSIASLSQARSSVVASAINNKIFFAGGRTNGDVISDQIDIYDETTDSWITSGMIQGKYLFAGIATNGNIYWAGGLKGTSVSLSGWSGEVEIRNAQTNTSIVTCLWTGRAAASAFLYKDDIIFYTSYPDNTWRENTFDIYNTVTNTWSIGIMRNYVWSEPTIIPAGDNIYVANGNDIYLLKY
jgi:hypothetical protein